MEAPGMTTCTHRINRNRVWRVRSRGHACGVLDCVTRVTESKTIYVKLDNSMVITFYNEILRCHMEVNIIKQLRMM